MKKLILSVVVILGGFSMHASSNGINPMVEFVLLQDDYKEVDAVPAAIKTALDNAYPGVKLEKAYVNSKKEYKIEISVREEKSIVYTDAKGNIIKK